MISFDASWYPSVEVAEDRLGNFNQVIDVVVEKLLLLGLEVSVRSMEALYLSLEVPALITHTIGGKANLPYEGVDVGVGYVSVHLHGIRDHALDAQHEMKEGLLWPNLEGV